MSWPFADPPNTAVFTSRKVMSSADWVQYVTHDADDGAWQFHGPSSPTAEEDAVVVGLGSIVKRDPSLKELADLPLGWRAWRAAPSAPWQRRES